MASIDEKLFLWINGWVGAFPPFDRAMEVLTSDYLVPVSLSLALIGLWFVGSDRAARQRHQMCLFVALTAMGLSSLAVYTINALYFRPRPFVEHSVNMLFYQPTDSSFPSNPAAATVALAFAVWWVNRRVGSIMLAAALLYGFSRVYTGVHYPSDVVVGALIALAITPLVYKARDLLDPVLTLVLKVARIFCLA